MSKALLVVDMQNDFCHPDGNLYAEKSEAVLGAVNSVIEYFQEHNLQIIYTQDTHTQNSPEFDEWGEHCLVGSWGHEFHDDLLVDGEVLQKTTYDAFHGTDLETRLDGVDELVIVGTLASVCVLESASSARLAGMDVTVIDEAVGSISEERRNAGLGQIDFLYGEVTDLDYLDARTVDE